MQLALLGLSLLAGNLAAQSGEAPSKSPTPSVKDAWVHALGKAIELHAPHSLRAVSVDVQPSKSAAPWIVRGDAAVLRVVFRSRGPESSAVTYVLSPWQDLSLCGDASTSAAVLTVNQHAIVLGPSLIGARTDAARKLAKDTLEIVKDLCGASFCEMGTRIGHAPEDSPQAISTKALQPESVFSFKPYYVHLDYPNSVEGTWNAIASERMLLLTRRMKRGGKRHDFFAPANIDRALPRLLDPGEQRLAPSVDLEAAREKLNHAIAEVFLAALEAALAGDDAKAELERPKLLRRFLPALRKTIFSYPGHSGPAHAAGAAAFEMWSRRLEALLMHEDFPSYVNGHWPSTALSYDTGLVGLLPGLPPASAAHLEELRDAFGKWKERATQNPGQCPANLGDYMPSREELALAEVGFRLRAALMTTALGLTKNPKPCKFLAFPFYVRHPLAKKWLPPKARIGVEVMF